METPCRWSFLETRFRSRHKDSLAYRRTTRTVVQTRLCRLEQRSRVRSPHRSTQARDRERSSRAPCLYCGLTEQFDRFELTRIPRGENSAADALDALASTSDPLLKRIIPVEGIDNPSIDIAIKSAEPKEIATITNDSGTSEQTPEASRSLIEQLGSPIELQVPETADPEGTARERQFVTDEQYHARPDWRIPIFEYIQNRTQPSDKWEAQKLRAKWSRYCIMTDKLYKRSLVEPYLRCVNGLEALAILANTHDRICGSHSGGQALANRVKCHR
ncbi:unnamed protein product [Microthlaspi erraticum]|uniref:RNase H type-1 domain-containing protein n=1 Tax=Microthlaspi erraticum TaxID=1685480 RepID=A0A6D2KYM1_9BRAS|nr:unnamed protein product [Microthlaspi erraticum]